MRKWSHYMAIVISAKKKMKSDTIVAISTPRGVGGIAVIRLSGPQAKDLALRFLSVDTLLPRHSQYSCFSSDGELVDEVLAVYFPAPHSYTGEEMVELSCHGSLYVQQAILQALLDGGARLADPGEYTLRAFLGGKLNLSQAEAVADLIDSATPVQHRLAVSQLRGGYAQKLKMLRQQLVDLTSLLELELDFSQEDVEFADRTQLRDTLADLAGEVMRLIGSFSLGNALKRGIPVAIVGRPNAGKSSLLNALLDDDRALVSNIPGTTRDTIEEILIIDGLTFRFIDTAGLRHSDDSIEAMGVERSRRAVADADVVLYVHDATCPWQTPEIDLSEKQVIYVNNKGDLGITASLPTPSVDISAKTGVGLSQLRAMLTELYRSRIDGSNTLLSNERHYEALLRVQEALDAAARGVDGGVPADLVAVDLRDALYHLGTITGQVSSDELLGNIFGRFCIGK